nr:uncharacterized protein LOC111772767 isoform X1 [Equus caballus]
MGPALQPLRAALLSAQMPGLEKSVHNVMKETPWIHPCHLTETDRRTGNCQLRKPNWQLGDGEEMRKLRLRKLKTKTLTQVSVTSSPGLLSAQGRENHLWTCVSSAWKREIPEGETVSHLPLCSRVKHRAWCSSTRRGGRGGARRARVWGGRQGGLGSGVSEHAFFRSSAKCFLSTCSVLDAALDAPTKPSPCLLSTPSGSEDKKENHEGRDTVSTTSARKNARGRCGMRGAPSLWMGVRTGGCCAERRLWAAGWQRGPS